MSKSRYLSSQEFGRLSEQKALDHYIKEGYELVEQNYQYYQKGVTGRLGEIDLIVKKDDVIVFVEVKARRGSDYGSALEQINPKKATKLIGAYHNFILDNPDYKDCVHRFDLVAIDSESLQVYQNIDLS